MYENAPPRNLSEKLAAKFPSTILWQNFPVSVMLAFSKKKIELEASAVEGALRIGDKGGAKKRKRNA